MSPAPIQEFEDINIVKQYILLPILATYLERDIKSLEKSQLHLSQVYVKQYKLIQEKVFKDIYYISKQMRVRGLKVYEQQKTQKDIKAKYLCRGYRDTMNLSLNFIKVQVTLLLSEYLNIDLAAEV